jgi:hypothetical protein
MKALSIVLLVALPFGIYSSPECNATTLNPLFNGVVVVNISEEAAGTNLWYKIENSLSTPLLITASTCDEGPDFSNVYGGDDCGNLVRKGYDANIFADFRECSKSSKISFIASELKTYWLEDSVGAILLN